MQKRLSAPFRAEKELRSFFHNGALQRRGHNFSVCVSDVTEVQL